MGFSDFVGHEGAQLALILNAIEPRCGGVLFAGEKGSGKTTLANAFLNEIAKTNDRCIIIEDTQELQCSAPDVVFMRSRERKKTD